MLFRSNDFSIRVYFLKIKNIADIRSSEFVNRLVIIKMCIRDSAGTDRRDRSKYKVQSFRHGICCAKTRISLDDGGCSAAGLCICCDLFDLFRRDEFICRVVTEIVGRADDKIGARCV